MTKKSVQGPRGRSTWDGSRRRYRIRSVNRPLPNDAFDFEFPENLLIGEVDASGKSRSAIHLIGRDGQIAQSFADRAALDELGKKMGVGSRRQEPIWPTVVKWMASVGFVGVVAILLWRRFRRK